MVTDKKGKEPAKSVPPQEDDDASDAFGAYAEYNRILRS